MSFTRIIFFFSPQDTTIFIVCYRTEMISVCDQLKCLDQPVFKTAEMFIFYVFFSCNPPRPALDPV